MTLKEAYAQGTKLLAKKGIPDAELDAWYLLEYMTGISRALYFSDGEKEMAADLAAGYFELIHKREQRIPLQHLTGIQEFMGLTFQVNEHVLIPRQDTEILVEEVISILEKKTGLVSLLDMCTGSGCILLSIMKLLCTEHGYMSGKAEQNQSRTKQSYQPEISALHVIRGTGVDLSEKALDTAIGNAKMLDVNAEFFQSDLFENVRGCFSMIVSNPPYIRTAEIETLQEEVRDHDPLMALDGGADGLHFYRKIIHDSRKHLLPGGYLLFEIGCDQAEDVSGFMREAGFQNISVKKDLAGLDRVISGVYDRESKN